MGTCCCKENVENNEFILAKTEEDNENILTTQILEKKEEIPTETKPRSKPEDENENEPPIQIGGKKEDIPTERKPLVRDKEEEKVFTGRDGKFKITKTELLQRIKNLKYTMINCQEVADKLWENPKNESRELKKFHHTVLYEARNHLLADPPRYKESNKAFALAYQTRCVCDWIYTNILGKQGDKQHTKFLEKEREFGKIAAELLTNKRQTMTAKEIKMIEGIKELKH